MRISPRVLRGGLRFCLSVGVIWGLYFLRDNIWFRAYPVVISAVMWGAFLFSLTKRRTPLVELSARAMRKTLNDAEVRYCRQLTVAWVIFMTLHLGVTIATMFLSHAFWALYNGCIAYLLIGLMFLAGLLIGKWRKLESGH
jgi:uncharacterized membrane protein